MTGRHDAAREQLPDLGRIQHLPHKPNTDRGDLVATAEEASAIFRASNVVVEEKVDGSQVGVCFSGDVPTIRNKNHVLVKGYGRKNTPAKAQYAPLWNWVYGHEGNFKLVCQQLGGPASVYGEWIFAEHTIRYDRAPEDFIAYDVYDIDGGRFLDPRAARLNLHAAGFTLPELLVHHYAHSDPLRDRPQAFYELLEGLTLQPSRWSTRDLREGVVVKTGDAVWLTHRFKMRRGDFKPRSDFNDRLRRRGEER